MNLDCFEKEVLPQEILKESTFKTSKHPKIKPSKRTKHRENEFDQQDTDGNNIRPLSTIVQNPLLFKRIRILKRDIRRQYANMFVNVMNLSDPSLIFRYFLKYCHPRCSYSGYLYSPAPSTKRMQQSDSTLLYELKGIEEMVNTVILHHLEFPDYFVHVQDVKIHIPFDKKVTNIIARMTMKGTRVFEVNQHQSSFYQHQETSSAINTAVKLMVKNAQESSIYQRVKSRLQNLQLLQLSDDQVTTIDLSGILVISLDSENCIKSFTWNIENNMRA